jgi:hypothetical protein
VRHGVRLVCRMPDGAQIVNSESGRSYRFAITDPGGELRVEGTVAAKGSELGYDPGSCEPSDPPTP